MFKIFSFLILIQLTDLLALPVQDLQNDQDFVLSDKQDVQANVPPPQNAPKQPNFSVGAAAATLLVSGLKEYGSKFVGHLTNPDLNIKKVWNGNFTSLKNPDPNFGILNVLKASTLFKPEIVPDFSYVITDSTTTARPTTSTVATTEPEQENSEEGEGEIEDYDQNSV